MSRTYLKTFPNGKRGTSESTFTVTPGRASVTTEATSTRIPGTDTRTRRALFPGRAARRIGRELEADGWTLRQH